LVDRDAILDGRRIAVLATTNADGSAYQTAIWYLWAGGAFLIPTSGESRKARNIAARPDASILVEERAAGLRGVGATGRAELIRGDEARELNAAIHARYLTPAGIDRADLGTVLAASDDVTIRLVPERWRTWDIGDVFGDLLADPENALPLDL
jgi:PPOX class probable F420-dependent enzyme